MALVLENTFTSIPAMAQQMFPGAQYLPLFFFRNQVCTQLLSVIVCVYFTLSLSVLVSEHN